ncbi:MAG: hypothetical protein ABIS38_08340 [Sphingomicrobium sp.]
MAITQPDQDLPEGTDSIIQDGVNVGAIATDRTVNDGDTGTLTIDSVDPVGSKAGGLSERLRVGGEKLSGQAADKARGFVGQGLERTSEALANVSRMVGDTAEGIEERLGADYGDYARRAAGAIENAANSLASKNPDELIEDTKTFVRNSPGVALAGAAVVGFVLARLIKSGLPASRDDDA